MRQGDFETGRLSKGPGRVRLLALPPGMVAAMYFSEAVTRARSYLLRARFELNPRGRRGHLEDARRAGRMAREWFAMMSGDLGGSSSPYLPVSQSGSGVAA